MQDLAHPDAEQLKTLEDQLTLNLDKVLSEREKYAADSSIPTGRKAYWLYLKDLEIKSIRDQLEQLYSL